MPTTVEVSPDLVTVEVSPSPPITVEIGTFSMMASGTGWPFDVYSSELESVVASSGSALTTLVITSPQTLGASLTIPANVSIEIKNGGVVTVPTGMTLAISGSFSAELYQCFAGEGTVVLSSVPEICPEWFGAKGDGTDDYSAWVAILAACQANGPTIRCRNATYHLSGTLTIGNGTDLLKSTIHNNLTIIGTGNRVDAQRIDIPSGTVFKRLAGSTNTGPVIRINGPVLGPNLQGIEVDGSGIALTCIHATHPVNGNWQQVTAREWAGVGVGEEGIILDTHPILQSGRNYYQGTLNNSFHQVYAVDPHNEGGIGIRIGSTHSTSVATDVLQSTFHTCRFVGSSTTATAIQWTATGITWTVRKSEQKMYVRYGSTTTSFSFLTYTTMESLRAAMAAQSVVPMGTVTLGTGIAGTTPTSSISSREGQVADVSGYPFLVSGRGYGMVLALCDNISFYNTITGSYNDPYRPSVLIYPVYNTGTPTATDDANGRDIRFPLEVTFFNCALIGGIETDTPTWDPYSENGSGIGFFPYPVSDGEAVPRHPSIYGVTSGGRTFGMKFDSGRTMGEVGDVNPWIEDISFLQTPTTTTDYTITNFYGGTEGQDLYLLFSDSHPTVQNNSSIKLNSGADYAGSTGAILHLKLAASGWFEVSRSNPSNILVHKLLANSTQEFGEVSDTQFEGHLTLRGIPTDSAARLYIMPKGTIASGVSAAIKVFSSDYEADPLNYKDMAWFYSATTDKFYLVAKRVVSGNPMTPPNVPAFVIGANDGDTEYASFADNAVTIRKPLLTNLSVFADNAAAAALAAGTVYRTATGALMVKY